MSKPFGVIITVPPPRIKGIRCNEKNCWPWENVNCERVQANEGCAGCTYAEEVVVVMHYPPDPPKE